MFDSACLSNSKSQEEQKLPCRDWILLPALSLLTILFLLSSFELIEYFLYADNVTNQVNCFPNNYGFKNYGAIPNCVTSDNYFEGSLVEYRLNSSGYRSDKDFGPKLPGTFRIVVIGSSIAIGYQVPIKDAFATRLAPDLSRLTGKKVETLNLGMLGRRNYPYFVTLRFKDALDFKPDMILRIVTPLDIREETASITTEDLNKDFHPNQSRVVQFFVRLQKHRLRFALMLQHFLFQSQSQYVKSYLMNGDAVSNVNLLKNQFDAESYQELKIFSSEDYRIEEKVKAAGVPLVTVLIPIRAQAAMISMGEWPDGYNPYKLGDELRSIVTSHGGTYVDILPVFRNIPNPEKYYMAIDGHPTVKGSAMISNMLASELTSGVIPSLNATPQEQEK